MRWEEKPHIAQRMRERERSILQTLHVRAYQMEFSLCEKEDNENCAAGGQMEVIRL